MPMPKRKSEEKPKLPQCNGGRGFGCNRLQHDQGSKIFCYRCQVYLGCSSCADKDADIVCLNCHDWGSLTARKTHGRMVKDAEVSSEAWRIIGMAQSGQVSAADADRLFADLFKSI